MSEQNEFSAPGKAEIESVAMRIAPHVIRTPVVPYGGPTLPGCEDSELFVKLELLQRTGSFKPRGALNALLNLDNPAAGVTAFSAGNHAIATAFAAQTAGVPVRVVMPKSANPFRVDRCRALGAEIEFGDDIASLLEIVERLQREEGLSLIHPFEGPHTVAGTATVGFELCSDVADLDAVIVPVGGGGLIAGIASAVKQYQPHCRVIGVEPEGAQGMTQSLAVGRALDVVNVSTIADSLGAPLHTPMTFSLIQQHVDDIVLVTDDQIRDAMRRMFHDLKLAVEPACASTLAALLHPLKGKLKGKRVAVIACGSNIDLATWRQHVS